MLQEFEIWTAEEVPRNVALASAGGKAEGKARRARDFESAYAASLTIDGEYTARWIGNEPTLTITLKQPETINRIFFASDRTGAGLEMGRETTPCEYRIEVSHDGKSWQEVANSLDRKPVPAEPASATRTVQERGPAGPVIPEAKAPARAELASGMGTEPGREEPGSLASSRDSEASA